MNQHYWVKAFLRGEREALVAGLGLPPIVHMQLAYGTAMLYARHFTETRRDFQQARAWMNLSIALAAGLDVATHRSFYSVFNRNGLA